MRRVRRRIAGQRQRLEAEPGRAVDGKARLQRQLAPVDAAVVAEHAEHRVAHRQVLAHAGGAPHRPWLAVLAQHVEAGGVVDLSVDQHDRGDAGVTQRARRLQRGKAADLLQHVGRGIEQHPVLVVAAGGNRRLGAGLGADASLAQAVAVGAVAVPLRETTTGGGTEYANLHRHSRGAHGHRRCSHARHKQKGRRGAGTRAAPPRGRALAVGDVHRDFKAEAHVAGCGGFPFHDRLLSCLWVGSAPLAGTADRFAGRVCEIAWKRNNSHHESPEPGLMKILRGLAGLNMGLQTTWRQAPLVKGGGWVPSAETRKPPVLNRSTRTTGNHTSAGLRSST